MVLWFRWRGTNIEYRDVERDNPLEQSNSNPTTKERVSLSHLNRALMKARGGWDCWEDVMVKCRTRISVSIIASQFDSHSQCHQALHLGTESILRLALSRCSYILMIAIIPPSPRWIHTQTPIDTIWYRLDHLTLSHCRLCERGKSLGIMSHISVYEWQALRCRL